MSRRHSRFASAISPDRGLTVDELLRGLARTPKTPRNRYRSAAGASAPKGPKPSTAALPNKHGGDRREDTILLEPLATVRRNEPKQDNSTKLKKREGAQRVDSNDIEWNALIGNGAPKKKRRKRYVVYNSLPLSRDPQNDRLQFSNERAEICPQPCGRFATYAPEDQQKRDIPAMRPNVRSAKPLHPANVICGMIVSPKEVGPGRRFGKQANSARTPNNNGEGLARSRNKPGSGFDWVNETLPARSGPASGNVNHVFAGSGVLEMAIPLPPVPEILRAQPSLGRPVGPIIETFDDKSQSNYITPQPPKKRRANDFPTYSEKASTAQPKNPHQVITKSPGVRQVRSVDNKINISRFPQSLAKLRPEGLTEGAEDLREGVDAGNNLDTGVMEDLQVTDTAEESTCMGGVNLCSYNTSQVSDMSQEDSPFETEAFIKHRSNQSGALTHGTISADSKPNSRVAKANAQKGAEALKKKRCGFPTSYNAEDIKTDENIAWRPQAKLLLKVSPTPPLVAARSDEDLVCIDDCVGPNLEGESRARRRVSIGEGEEESTSPASRDLSIKNPPERSYFSTAQQVLRRNFDSGVKFNPGYLRPPSSVTHWLNPIKEVINEEEQASQEDGDSVTRSTTPIDTYNINRTAPLNLKRTPIPLKDLLNKVGARRPSISGIFRAKRYSSAGTKPVIHGTKELNFCHKTDSSLTSSPISPQTTSKPLSTYACRRASSKVHRPYASPLGKPSLVIHGNEGADNSIGKLERGVGMLSRIKTRPPERKRFKPPLLKNRAKTLLDSGLGAAGKIVKRSRADLSEGRRELDLVIESRNIDIRKVSSFFAVQEAW